MKEITNAGTQLDGRQVRTLHPGSPGFHLRRLALALCSPLYAPSLRRAAARATDLDEHLQIVTDWHFRTLNIRPRQILGELRGLLSMLARHPPAHLLEIGTANGGSLYLFCQVAQPGATILSVDLPSGAFGGGYPRWKLQLYRAFATPGQDLHLLRGDSHERQTLRRVRQLLRNDSLDFLFIDGDHSLQGVSADFEMYSPLVREGGFVGFHDIVPGPARRVGSVPEYWQEIRKDHPHREIVSSWQQGGYGIGLLEMVR